MITLQAEQLQPELLNTYTINIDVCEYLPNDYLDWGALGSDIIERYGPAGGNPNVNIYFSSEFYALQFLQNYMGLDEEDDLYSFFV